MLKAYHSFNFHVNPTTWSFLFIFNYKILMFYNK